MYHVGGPAPRLCDQDPSLHNTSSALDVPDKFNGSEAVYSLYLHGKEAMVLFPDLFVAI